MKNLKDLITRFHAWDVKNMKAFDNWYVYNVLWPMGPIMFGIFVIGSIVLALTLVVSIVVILGVYLLIPTALMIVAIICGGLLGAEALLVFYAFFDFVGICDYFDRLNGWQI